MEHCLVPKSCTWLDAASLGKFYKELYEGSKVLLGFWSRNL